MPDISYLFSFEEVISLLHIQPALGCCPEKFAEFQGDFGVDSPAFITNLVDSSERHTESFRKSALCQIFSFMYDLGEIFSVMFRLYSHFSINIPIYDCSHYALCFLKYRVYPNAASISLMVFSFGLPLPERVL